MARQNFERRNKLFFRYPVNRPQRTTPPATEGQYTIHADEHKQTIWGLGFELQSDSIASGNKGLPEHRSSVPYDLIPSERERFYKEMLSGFRYLRLAGGLYYRGLDAEQKQLRERWPTQLTELRELIEKSGIPSVSFEYWSPAPFWKADRSYTRKGKSENILRCFGRDFAADPVYRGDRERFFRDFAAAIVEDIKYLRKKGIPVDHFGLQNEPVANTAYSSCFYSVENYGVTYVPVARAIRAYDPSIRLLCATWIWGNYVTPIISDPATKHLVDHVVVHNIGWDSKWLNYLPALYNFPLNKDGEPYPFYQNEYEYLQGPATPARCLNTVQNIMNWFQLADSPTWYWIHALKPVGNAEASGYSLGFWMPQDKALQPKGAHSLKPGHWTWNKYNWHAMAGFIKHMPWDSVNVKIQEETFQHDNRIFAFKRPDGKLVIVLTNRCTADYTFTINTGRNAAFKGYRYTPDNAGEDFMGVPCGKLAGPVISPTLADMTWEFWVEQP
ncbi:MAG: glycoside hydrolase family 30 beta sandwich domain-containing protein [Kiritimatiellia bacterium]